MSYPKLPSVPGRTGGEFPFEHSTVTPTKPSAIEEEDYLAKYLNLERSENKKQAPIDAHPSSCSLGELVDAPPIGPQENESTDYLGEKNPPQMQKIGSVSSSQPSWPYIRTSSSPAKLPASSRKRSFATFILDEEYEDEVRPSYSFWTQRIHSFRIAKPQKV